MSSVVISKMEDLFVITVRPSSAGKLFPFDMFKDEEKLIIELGVDFQGSVQIKKKIQTNDLCLTSLKKVAVVPDDGTKKSSYEYTVSGSFSKFEPKEDSFDSEEPKEDSFESEQSVVDYELSQQY